MNKYLGELRSRGDAGDIGAHINLLFRTRYDLGEVINAMVMARELNHRHPICDVMYDLWFDNESDVQANKCFGDLKAMAQTEENAEIRSIVLNMLGFFYSSGIGIKLDMIEGLKYYELAFSEGNMFAAHNLGLHYWNLGEYDWSIWYLLKASTHFIGQSIQKLERIVYTKYDFLSCKNKELILNQFIECSSDGVSGYSPIQKILAHEHILWNIKHHRFWANLYMGGCGYKFQTYVLLLLCISKYRKTSCLKHMTLFHKNIALSVIKQSACMRELRFMK